MRLLIPASVCYDIGSDKGLDRMLKLQDFKKFGCVPSGNLVI